MERVQPRLEGKKVSLRPFVASDAAAVEELAGAREIADTTLSIPHPYPPGVAATWIATHAPAWERGEQAHFAITIPPGALVGAMSLMINPEHGGAEVGYWVGVPYWNRGYCTEAGRLILGFGFEVLGLHRIQGRHLIRNPASGRVMQKIGMSLEGVLRGALKKWDRFEDVRIYAILAPEWEERSVAGTGQRGEARGQRGVGGGP